MSLVHSMQKSYRPFLPSLSKLLIFPLLFPLLSWLQLYLSAFRRLQRSALWEDAAAEIQLDPAEERREQVGQQRHPAVPRISGCKAVPPFFSSPCTDTHRHMHTHPQRSHSPTRVCIQTLCRIKTQTLLTPTTWEYSNMHMSKGLPQWKYCPLIQACLTRIIQTVGECWQTIRNTKHTLLTFKLVLPIRAYSIFKVNSFLYYTLNSFKADPVIFWKRIS